MQNEKKPVIGRILRYTKPCAGLVVPAVLAAVVSVALSLYTPILVGRGIDYIIGKNNVDFDGVKRYVLLIAATVVLSAVFNWVMSYCTYKITYRAVSDMRAELYAKLNKLPLGYIDSTPHGDVIARMSVDIETVSDGLLQCFSQFLTGIVTIVGTIIFMLRINVRIAVVVILITPLSLFVAAFITKLCHDKFREQSAVRGELSGCIEELVGGQKIVKAFAYEDRAQTRFEEINGRLYKCGVLAQFYSALTNPCTRFVNGLVYAATGIFGAVSVINGGSMSVGQIATFLSYANQYTKPFNEITGVITELQAAFASARRVFEVLDGTEETPEKDPPAAANPDGRVRIENVGFSYKPGQKLLENVSLDVKPGQRIAVVGPTGCGKTTLINLLMRFYDVREGSIKVGGEDVRDMRRGDLRAMYGMVLQDTWIFTGTIRENIAYGKPEATEEEILAAAKMCHCHSFIRRMPNGYDTMVSEDGGSLSQGQKQLLCIARVMLTNPPMLILDEATSSIDTRTEQKIQSAFAKLMKGKTSFIIAHRLSTIRDADVILVMKDGNIIEQGNHESLLEKGGFYANLYNSQFEHA
ncbi:MAG: ABC transporter ATP-binding protein/permease [Ruminococcus sp.]|nr:ABC transporter ATP-binding protein/permease [Ruminococcus sp.]MCM1478399.1 ABC transporter ATP-binding protein/permease [Muribaculaceae bacterium]